MRSVEIKKKNYENVQKRVGITMPLILGGT